MLRNDGTSESVVGTSISVMCSVVSNIYDCVAVGLRIGQYKRCLEAVYDECRKIIHIVYEVCTNYISKLIAKIELLPELPEAFMVHEQLQQRNIELHNR
jgi:hypothetical protein